MFFILKELLVKPHAILWWLPLVKLPKLPRLPKIAEIVRSHQIAFATALQFGFFGNYQSWQLIISFLTE
jgi:hypothetical protein